MATRTADPAALSRGALSVPAGHARPFEPAGLGPLYPVFAGVLQRIANKRQSEVLRLIAAERQAWEGDTSAASLAYRLTLSVLADYIAFGNYPLVANGRCFLVPVFESEGFPPERRRALVQRLFCLARDRALAERGQLGWAEAAVTGLAHDQYQPGPVIAAMHSGPPEFRLLEARSSARTLRHARTMARCPSDLVDGHRVLCAWPGSRFRRCGQAISRRSARYRTVSQCSPGDRGARSLAWRHLGI